MKVISFYSKTKKNDHRLSEINFFRQVLGITAIPSKAESDFICVDEYDTKTIQKYIIKNDKEIIKIQTFGNKWYIK